jgi:hypothetical protein
MYCQRARLINTPFAYHAMEGKELWLAATDPQQKDVYSVMQKRVVTYFRAHCTPYVMDDGESRFGVEAHRVELLARGPQDFANVPDIPFAEWLAENGVDVSFE